MAMVYERPKGLTFGQIKRQVEEFLREHDTSAYSYNDIECMLHTQDICKVKGACEGLWEEGRIIRNKNPKGTRKKVLYKYARYSRFVCCRATTNEQKRDKKRAICSYIIGLLTDTPDLTHNDIQKAVKRYYFKIDRNVVSQALMELRDKGAVSIEQKTKGSVTAFHFYLTGR